MCMCGLEWPDLVSFCLENLPKAKKKKGFGHTRLAHTCACVHTCVMCDVCVHVRACMHAYNHDITKLVTIKKLMVLCMCNNTSYIAMYVAIAGTDRHTQFQ